MNTMCYLYSLYFAFLLWCNILYLICYKCICIINDNFKLFVGWQKWSTYLLYHDIVYESLSNLWDSDFWESTLSFINLSKYPLLKKWT